MPALDVNRSRVVTSDSRFANFQLSSPALNAVNSEIILFGGGLLSAHALPGFGLSTVILEDTKLTRAGGVTIDLFCQSFPLGQPCPPELTLLGSSEVRSSEEGGITLDEATEGQISVGVELGMVAKFVALVASLPAQPVETVIGTFYNDPASSLILNFGAMNQAITIPAFAGHNRLGIPITFQAAMVLQDDSVVLSLPRTSIF